MKTADIVASLLKRFPAQWAEPWDNVGLIVGDPAAEVDRVVVALDLVAEVLEDAATQGAGLVLTHHPPFLAGNPPSMTGGDSVTAAARRGISVASFHTNLDRSPDGAGALARALGLPDGLPLESSLQDAAKVVVFVPEGFAGAVRDAMRRAGAGRVGLYEGCSFEGEGTGRFLPLEGSTPSMGDEGVESRAAETRLEMVCPREVAQAVAEAAATEHPYEEPLIVVEDCRIRRGAARLGRVSDAPDGATVRSVAETAFRVFGSAPVVWGEADRPVRKVATAGGSASSLLDQATAAGADVLVCGEVRYHEALEAAQRGLALVVLGHDVSEYPVVGVLADAARSVTMGREVEIVAAGSTPRWWTWGV